MIRAFASKIADSSVKDLPIVVLCLTAFALDSPILNGKPSNPVLINTSLTDVAA